MKAKGLLFICCLCIFLSACTTPKPLSDHDTFEEAKKNIKNLFDPQKNFNGHLDFNQALARGIKFNLDYRIKIVNTALQAGQLKVAQLTMLPLLNTTDSIYTRDNDYSTVGTTIAGQPTNVYNSTPRTLLSERLAFSWNLLDFGLGYVRSKEQSERVLIAEEESRKQLQQLAQDIRIAYWRAYSAQQLMIEVKEFQILLLKAKKNLNDALQDPTIPQQDLLNFQAALLQGDRNLVQLQYKLDKAMLDLKRLLSLPAGTELILETPPLSITKTQDLSHLDFNKLDAITLVKRPELRGQRYQQRIAELGVTEAIVQALPGITLNDGWNFNSNKFLLNTEWLDRSMDLSWNLLRLLTLPTAISAAKTQISYEQLKLMALTLTAITETRYAYSHYYNLAKEYSVAHQQTENTRSLYELVRNRNKSSLASKQEVILAKLHTITAEMDENLLLADLSTALGELYLSAGFDFIPPNIMDNPTSVASKIIRDSFAKQNTMNFKSYVDTTYNNIFGKLQIMDKPQEQGTFTLQMFGSYNAETVKHLQESLHEEHIHLATTKNKGRDWYILTYGKYKTREKARLTIPTLPVKLKVLAPWARPTGDLKLLSGYSIKMSLKNKLLFADRDNLLGPPRCLSESFYRKARFS